MPKSNATKAKYPLSEAQAAKILLSRLSKGGSQTLEESHFHLATLSSSGWHETSYTRAVDLTTQQESLFQAAKMKKSFSTETCIIQPSVSWPLTNLIFRPPKHPTQALLMPDTYRSMVSRHLSAFSFAHNSIKVFTRSHVPLNSGSHNSTQCHQNVEYGPPVFT